MISESKQDIELTIETEQIDLLYKIISNTTIIRGLYTTFTGKTYRGTFNNIYTMLRSMIQYFKLLFEIEQKEKELKEIEVKIKQFFESIK